MPRESTQTFVLVKPDGLDRQLVGQILTRFEQAGLQLAALDLRRPDQELVAEHYQEHGIRNSTITLWIT